MLSKKREALLNELEEELKNMTGLEIWQSVAENMGIKDPTALSEKELWEKMHELWEKNPPEPKDYFCLPEPILKALTEEDLKALKLKQEELLKK